ncbi:MAG TPA: hypothetical protein VGJ20_42030 [Xanthobacteraceae bacterium]
MKNTGQAVVIVLAIAAMAHATAGQDKPTRFWNLTVNAISDFRLAPAGTSDWGPNQCKNDRDGVVDSDERLRITDVPSGTYDVKFTDVRGRTCFVRGIKVEAGAIFAIDEKNLASCVH